MIINGAQRYGLAQLYQLRGRIGRSSQRATCLLLVESTGSLTDKAMRRVTTIQKFVEPGSGFAVASQDMEIRGVGDLLGAEQSGNIHAVGLDTYLDLLAEAVEELRGEAGPVPARIDPELRIALETRIPTAWIPDTVLRLRLYRALARSRSIEEVRDVFESAVDRFGKAPKSARRLVELMELKSLAADLGFAVVTYNSTSLALTLTKHGRLRPELITELLGRAGNRFRLTPGLQLVRSVSPQEWNGELDGLRETLREIWNFVSNGPLRP
jgi:transcription-repair coupling factor (superfamily II helicase)